MLRLLQILFVFGLFLSCANRSMVDRSEEKESEKPHLAPSPKGSAIAGKWLAIQLQQKDLSGEVCSQYSYVLEIDSTGIVYSITNDTLNRERMGWIEPEEGEIRAFKTDGDLTKFRFRKYSEDQFRLQRNLSHPPDHFRKPDPLADPVTYPDGTVKPVPIRCDTEVWKFKRITEE